MSAVRLVRDQHHLSDAVSALTALREAVRGAMPGDAEVRVCLNASGEIAVDVLVSSYEARETGLFNVRSGLVPGATFHAVTHGLEHGTRGRHRISAIVDR